MPPRKALRVLCFGDSLTSGYCCFGMDSHPYSLRLQQRLEDGLPDTKIEIVTRGEPGDVAAFRHFGQRLKTECEKRWFDWVIILGGTNDIATGISVDQIIPALQANWDLALSKNSKVVALTVPECHSKSSRLNRKRDNLNSQIMNHEQPNFHAFDLKEKIPYHSLSDDDREKYWDDGLHLAPDGYDWMGDHIADYLIPVIQREEQTEPAGSITKAPARGTARPSNAPPSTSADDQAEPVTPKPKRLHEGDFQPPKPKAKKVAPAAELGDTPDIEEEGGSTRNISQGYVVVRKHDLH